MRIVSLCPSLTELGAEALIAAGVTCHTSLPVTTRDTAEMVRSIGGAVGRAKEAEAIARDIEIRSERARQAAMTTLSR